MAKPRLIPLEVVYATVEKLGFRRVDAEAWEKKWKTLRVNAKHKGVECELSFEQYLLTALRANIKRPIQIGIGATKMQMARKGDTGNYVYRRCRFCLPADNTADKYINGGIDAQREKRTGRTAKTHTYVASATDKKSMDFKVVSPQNKTFKGRNLKEFCREHGLSQGHLSAVCRGQKQSYKGWTGRYV